MLGGNESRLRQGLAAQNACDAVLTAFFAFGFVRGVGAHSSALYGKMFKNVAARCYFIDTFYQLWYYEGKSHCFIETRCFL